MGDIAIWIALANILVSLIGIPAVLIWKLRGIELDLRRDITLSRNEVTGRIDGQYREFGETVAAIRQGVTIEVALLRKELTDSEKYNRDTFMRRDSFYNVQKALEGSIGALGEKIEKRLERMEEKIDSKT